MRKENLYHTGIYLSNGRLYFANKYWLHDIVSYLVAVDLCGRSKVLESDIPNLSLYHSIGIIS